MKQLLNKIDGYLDMKEKYDIISLSSKSDDNLSEIIEIIKKSSDKERVISMLNDDVKQKIEKLMEGGIL
jgi:hypothetical protein